MKKNIGLTALLAALTFCASLSGCGSTETSVSDTTANTEVTAEAAAKIDGVDHVSVYPTYMFTMQQWIDSRSDAENNPHPYSVLLRSISVRVG